VFIAGHRLTRPSIMPAIHLPARAFFGAETQVR
jgi:hypothetical protein